MIATLTEKKITLATLKKFVRENRANLLIMVKSEFDGMTDGVVSTGPRGFQAAKPADDEKHTLGVDGVCITGSAPNFYERHEGDGVRGIRVSNCCGCFVVAVKV